MRRMLLTVFTLSAFLAAVNAWAGLSDFQGLWRNSNKNTRGLTKLNIQVKGKKVTIEIWGKAHPRDTYSGKLKATPYSTGVGTNVLRNTDAVLCEFNNSFSRRLIIVHRPRRRKIAVEEFVRFTDGSSRSAYHNSYWFEKQLMIGTIPGRIHMPSIVLPRVKPDEDAIAFNPARVKVKKINGHWKIVDGRMWLKDFGRNRREAEQALRVIKHYGFNRQCFVGRRPDPSLEYYTVGDKAPEGPMRGEDCTTFNPKNIRVIKSGRHWKIVDGSHALKAFPNKAEADKALQIIKYYGFTHSCFIGRSDPSMTYFRK